MPELPFQPVADTAEARFKYTCEGGDFPAQNVLYVKNTIGTPWTGTNLVALGETLETWWNNNIKPLQSTRVKLNEIALRDLETEFGASASTTVETDGTRVGDLVASIAACVVRFTGDSGGAPRQGRIFHIGAIESDAAGDAFTSTYQGLLEDAYTALPGALTAGSATWVHVIVSRFQNNAQRNPALTKTVTDYAVRGVMGSQQRRRRNTSSYLT